VKDKRGFIVAGEHSTLKISVLVICCLALTKDSEAKPLAEDSFTTAYADREQPLAIEPEHFLSAPFRLSDWYQDHGSGGFPENFSDEHPRLDEWENFLDE
jgi:hypothetical protein